MTLTASKNEKDATLRLLEHLAEIDRRKLYADKGFPSLWLYVHEFLGYSESQTSERVSAMRLMVKIPEVKKELEEGKISLTSASKLASHVRREKAGNKETLQLLSEISGKTSREVDQHLAKHATVEFQLEKLKIISPTITRIMIDVDDDFLNLMNRVRELKGHHASTTQELLKCAMKETIKQHELRAPKVKSSREESKLNHTHSQTNSQSRYISTEIRYQIRKRSGDQCEFIDPGSEKRCPSKMKLEFDHIKPFALGGKTTFENLRHYCPAHNQYSAIRQFGREHMSQFMKN